MPTYPATNDLSALVETDPLGSYPPSDIDDVIRETRLCFKNVVQKGHSSTGLHKTARMYATQAPSTALGHAVSATNIWYRVGLTTVIDTSSILQTPDYTNCHKPVAGTYLVRWFCSFYQSESAMACIRQGASNAIDTTASINIATMMGTMSYSGGTTAAIVPSVGSAIWTTDGSINIGLEYMVQRRDTTNGHVIASGATFNTNIGGLYVPYSIDLFQINT